MDNLLVKMILSKKIRFEDGRISLKNIDLLIIPDFFIKEISMYYFEKKQPYLLYYLAWIGGFQYAYLLKKIFNLNNPDLLYNFGMDLIASTGFGSFKTQEYTQNRYTHFIITNNPLVTEKIENISFFDYFLCGLMAGGGTVQHNKLCQTVELKCVANGDQYCEFITGTEEYLLNKTFKDKCLWDICEDRYLISKYLDAQKYVFDNYNLKNSEEIVKKYLSMIK